MKFKNKAGFGMSFGVIKEITAMSNDERKKYFRYKRDITLEQFKIRAEQYLRGTGADLHNADLYLARVQSL